MAIPSNRFECPLCHSLLTRAKYLEIVGIWEERMKLEKALKNQLQALQQEKRDLLAQRQRMQRQMQRQLKAAVREAVRKGREQEKGRAERLSKMIERKAEEIQGLNRKIRELQEQLRKGTTPQVEGLNLEKELVKELKRNFEEDTIEPHGKSGDIIQRVNFNKKPIGTILYECKKTATFHNDFIDQAKKAMAARQATYGVLVTAASKRKTAGFWVEKDILIVHPYGAVYIARVLRNSIVELHCLQVDRSEMEKRSRALWDYIRGNEFRNGVEDTIYRARTLYDMLKKEAKTHTKVWQRRFGHYKAIHENASHLSFSTSNILKGLPFKGTLLRGKVKELAPPRLTM